VVKEKNLILCVILCFITCGIYPIYWFICLTDDFNELLGRPGTSGIMAFLLTLITCGIYGFYWSYKQGEKIDEIKTGRGVPSSNSGVLYLILALLSAGIIPYILMQNEINKLV